jgi:hypothetical protein
MADELIGFPNATLPKVLYHYCGVVGLKGIIEGKAVWLSDVRYCNDFMEHNWLKERYDYEIDYLRHQQPSPFHDALAAEKANYREHLAFIACFSTESDVLSQWRAYADDGAGFAIGFNPNYFALSLSAPRYGSDQGTTHGLFPVCYDLDQQIALIKTIIEHYRTESQQQDADVKKYATDCYFNLQMVSITCKNPAFAEEKEWRIVYRPMIWRKAAGLEILGGNSDIAFRTSRSNLVPYFKLSFSEKRQCRPIEEVVLGPKQSLTKELDVLTWFFEKNEVNVAGLRQSTATYR